MRTRKFVLILLLISGMLLSPVLMASCTEKDTIFSGSSLRPDNYPGPSADDQPPAADETSVSTTPQPAATESEPVADESETDVDEPETDDSEPEVRIGIVFKPDPIDFGQVCIGETATITLKGTNSGNIKVTIKEYPFIDGPFMGSFVGPDTTISPDGSFTWTFQFTPVDEGVVASNYSLFYDYTVEGESNFSMESVEIFGDGIRCEPKPWNVFLDAFNLSYVTVPPCSCPTWPACGCGPGTYSFTLILTVMGDDPEPMPGATVSLSITGPGTERTETVTTNEAGQARFTFSTGTGNRGTFTATVTGITGEFDGRAMEYTPEMNIVDEATTTTQ